MGLSGTYVVKVNHVSQQGGNDIENYTTRANGTPASIREYFFQDGGLINVGDGAGGDRVRMIESVEVLKKLEV